MQLTDFDRELLELTTVPEEALQKVKDIFELPILQYFGYDEEEYDYVAKDGICVDLDKLKYTGRQIRNWVSELNAFFAMKGLGLMAFGSEYFIQLEDGDDCVAVIPAEDGMAPIRAAGTAGFNAGVSNEDIIDTLLTWKEDHEMDFRVIYADMQQIDCEFIKKPADLKALAEDIHDFSPDLVDRLENGEDDLVKMMSEEGLFSLYWD